MLNQPADVLGQRSRLRILGMEETEITAALADAGHTASLVVCASDATIQAL